MNISMLWLVLPICLGITLTIAYLLMLHLTGSSTANKGFRILHRTMGGLAILFWVGVVVLTMRQARQSHGILSSTSTTITILSSLFLPILIAKVVIIRKYPELRNRLFTLGTILFAFGFSMFLIALLPQVTGSSQALLEIAGESDFVIGRDLFVVKCSKCHRIESILTADRSPKEWEKTIEIMAKKDVTWISESEAARIHKFLSVVASRSTND